MSRRARRIASVTVRRLALAAIGARLGLASRERRRAALSRHVRLACEELGPTFIKLGQLASIRPDLFPPHIVFELEKLQDSVAPVSAVAVRASIRSGLGASAETLFASFDDEPLASASIAQVHRATLDGPCRAVDGTVLPPGCQVVVKVVRPGIAAIIAEDLALARRMLRRVPRVGAVRRFPLEALIDEFERSLRSELDLRVEGRIADRFGFDFRDDPLVVVPRVAWRLSSRRVLVMEYVEGWRLTDIGEAERSGIDAYGLAVHGAEVFMKQVLVHGRYHADLHPANLFVTPDGRICYLDFGITGQTEPAQRVAIAQVLAATVYGDADRAVRYSRELGLEIPDALEARVRERVASLLQETMRGPGPSDVRGFAVGFLSMLSDFDIPIPAGYGLLIKALVTVEGVARRLYPQIDIARAAKGFATNLIARQMLAPARVAQKAPDVLRAALRELAT